MGKIVMGLILAALLGGCASDSTKRGVPNRNSSFGSGDAGDPYRQIVPVP